MNNLALCSNSNRSLIQMDQSGTVLRHQFSPNIYESVWHVDKSSKQKYYFTPFSLVRIQYYVFKLSRTLAYSNNFTDKNMFLIKRTV